MASRVGRIPEAETSRLPGQAQPAQSTAEGRWLCCFCWCCCCFFTNSTALPPRAGWLAQGSLMRLWSGVSYSGSSLAGRGHGGQRQRAGSRQAGSPCSGRDGPPWFASLLAARPVEQACALLCDLGLGASSQRPRGICPALPASAASGSACGHPLCSPQLGVGLGGGALVAAHGAVKGEATLDGGRPGARRPAHRAHRAVVAEAGGAEHAAHVGRVSQEGGAEACGRRVRMAGSGQDRQQNGAETGRMIRASWVLAGGEGHMAGRGCGSRLEGRHGALGEGPGGRALAGRTPAPPPPAMSAGGMPQAAMVSRAFRISFWMVLLDLVRRLSWWTVWSASSWPRECRLLAVVQSKPEQPLVQANQVAGSLHPLGLRCASVRARTTFVSWAATPSSCLLGGKAGSGTRRRGAD